MKHPVINYSLIVLLFRIGRADIELPKYCEFYNGFLGGVRIFGVTCSHAHLGVVPYNFPNDINFLEIQFDYMKSLTSLSFLNYPHLQYLSLRHVGVEHIAEDTFSSLRNLVKLDLSENAIAELPPLPSSIEILCLNSMLNSSHFFDSNRTFERMVQLRSSLKTLLLTGNRLRYLPPFVKELRKLKRLLVSANRITHLSVEDMAPFCRLEEFDFTNNMIGSTHRYTCDCLALENWAFERGLKIYGLDCPTSKTEMDRDRCEEKFGQFPALQLPEYLECQVLTFLWTYWVHVVSGLTVFAVLTICLCRTCRQEREKRRNFDRSAWYTKVEIDGEMKEIAEKELQSKDTSS